MKPDLTLQERHLVELRHLLTREDGTEAAAYILCGVAEVASDPWNKQRRYRYTSYEVVSVPAEDLISANTQHVSWSTDSFVRLLKRAKDDGLVIGIVHTHPLGPSEFSGQDDVNERELAKMGRNRNGPLTQMLSILLSGESDIRARIWLDQYDPMPISSIRAIGRQYRYYDANPVISSAEHLNRQALVFGDQINTTLRSMKIGVVGCGGTGSAVAMLLARLGAGQLALFDDDIVEITNLNRLHGARRSDVDAMRPKVDVVAREIAAAALGVKILPIKGWIGNPAFRDALKSCDVIFGCTDDNDGRMLLNRFAYFYLIPVIDVGLAITPAEHNGKVQDLSGRATVLFPEAPCLMCHGVVDPVKAREEDLRRKHPEDYERQKREAYVLGGGNPAPAVVTFTTATACMAVDELLQGLTNFRKPGGWAWNRVRRFDLMKDRIPGAKPSERCPICADQEYWGKADIEPFLDRVG